MTDRAEIRLSRSGQVRASTWDPSAHTVQVTWTGNADVTRFDWATGREYVERLPADASAWDLSRLNGGGGPVLNSHQFSSLSDQIGVVMPGSATFDGSVGSAVVRLSDAPGDSDVVRKIATGICRNISFGYETTGMVETKADDGSWVRTFSGVQVYELSFVPVPADASAMSRGKARKGSKMAKRDLTPGAAAACATAAAALSACAEACEAGDEEAAKASRELAAAACETIVAEVGAANPVVTAACAACAEVCKSGDLDTCAEACEATAAALNSASEIEADEPAADAATEAGEPAGDQTMDADQIKSAERARAAEIMSATRHLGLPADRAEALIADGTTADQARKLLIAERAKSEPVLRTTNAAAVEVRPNGPSIDQRCADAISARANGKEPVEHARAFAGREFGEVCRAYLVEHGDAGARELPKSAVIQRAMNFRQGTSDFPKLLDNVLNKSLLAAYEMTPSVYRQIAAQRTASDLKTQYPTIMSGATDLATVSPAADYPIAVLKDSRESYAVAKKGLMIQLTLESLINDDLSAFGRVPLALVQASERAREKVVIGLITANAAMSDSYNLFDGTNHLNVVAVGAAPTPASIDALMKLIDLQKGVNGEELGIEGRIILAPRALRQVIEQIYAIRSTPGAAVATTGLLTDPQLGYERFYSRFLDTDSATKFYALANPALHPALQYAVLEGQEKLQLSTYDQFFNDVRSYKATDFFGAGVVDFRAIAQNPGV